MEKASSLHRREVRRAAKEAKQVRCWTWEGRSWQVRKAANETEVLRQGSSTTAAR